MSTRAARSARNAKSGQRQGMDAATRRRLRFLAGFAAYFIALWLLWDTPVVFPLKVFVVLLHEISHGIAAVASGGSIQRIAVDWNEGGYCFCPGGNAFITLSAGYLGSLAWGALLLLVANGTAKRNRVTLLTIGSIIAVVTVLYVRNVFGLVFGAAAGAALIGAARSLTPAWNRGVLTVLGLTSCLYAILDIKSDVIDRAGIQSDAAMLAEITRVPTMVWGFLWIGVALAVCFLLGRRIWQKA